MSVSHNAICAMAPNNSNVCEPTAFSVMPLNPKHKICPEQKLIVLGGSGVGKTSLLQRMTLDSFSAGETQPTLTGDFLVKMLQLDDRAPIKMQLWDTAGQEAHGAGLLPNAYFRRAHGAMLVYDVSDRYSFEQLVVWTKQLVAFHGNTPFAVAVVANKSDLPAVSRKVSRTEGQALAQTLHAEFFECSAKSAQNVLLSLSSTARRICQQTTWMSPVLPSEPSAIAPVAPVVAKSAAMMAHPVVKIPSSSCSHVADKCSVLSPSVRFSSRPSGQWEWLHELRKHQREAALLLGSGALLVACSSLLLLLEDSRSVAW